MYIPIKNKNQINVKNKCYLFVDSEDLKLKLKTLNNLIVYDCVNVDSESNTGSTIENSDLVALGILPKQVSEYTDADIGSIISIPYTDSSGNITGPIEFEVVGVNHHKDISDESKPTITLMTKNIIRYAAFDAKEPNDPLFDYERSRFGNNRWSVSNIRQWLNSEGAANEWFTPQHEYDEAPIADKVDIDSGAYADNPGFLAGFSDEIKQHLATVRNKTKLFHVESSTLSKQLEETEDKVFLPSYTEMGFGNIDDNNPEGSHLSQKFNDNSSRVKTGISGTYWMRTPSVYMSPGYVYTVIDFGVSYENNVACYGKYGIAPLIVLS